MRQSRKECDSGIEAEGTPKAKDGDSHKGILSIRLPQQMIAGTIITNHRAARRVPFDEPHANDLCNHTNRSSLDSSLGLTQERIKL